MKRDIIILDTVEIKCPLVLLYVFKELTGYFVRNGYIVRIVNNLTKLHDNSIVFMGNFFGCNNPVELLEKYAPNAIYIAWYWNNIDASRLKYFIYTYENCLNIYHDPSRINDFIKLKNMPHNTPLLLRSNENPELIGNLPRNTKYDFCYFGYPYCLELFPRQKYKGIYKSTYNHSEFVDYETRKKCYLSSIFAFGWQSDTNIGYKHVSQRIYEGLTYGCIVLTNSKPACEQTNNIAIYVNTLKDVENVMEYFINNPELIIKKQKEGYEFARKYGTNEYAINQFKELIIHDFNIEI